MASRLPFSTSPSFNQRTDEEPVRLLTRLHLAGDRPALACFQVVADLLDGRQALLSRGLTRPEAVARTLEQGPDLPPGLIGFRVQRWAGAPGGGRWLDLPAVRGEFDTPPNRSRRRSERLGRRR